MIDIPTMQLNKLLPIGLLLLGHLIVSCKKDSVRSLYDIRKSAESTKGMVVTAHPLATQAGLEILAKGGTAADAAVAVQFTLAVVYPRAGNLGGGGFLTYRNEQGEIFTLDYREKAPARADRDMYLDSLGEIIPGASRDGILAVGVPGSVAGLVETHKIFGKLRWALLLEPAIRLARNGFRITSSEADRLNHYRDVFLEFNSDSMPFVLEGSWQEGDLLVQSDLAATLQLIANEGHDGFYNGANAEFLLNTVQEHGGLISREDLMSYEAVWRRPVSFRWRDYEIHSVGLPSSGGIMLNQLFMMIESRLADSLGPRHPANVHLLVEAERRAYADRTDYLGDSDFYSVPVDSLLSEEYLSNRLFDFDPDSASLSIDSDSAIYKLQKESFETTHLSITDAEGNAASVTTTLNDNYGCKVWVPGGGYFLNNEMDDFSIKPGVPNLYGLIGSEANSIEPHKRMLSSMTPTIVEKSGSLYLVLGTPGGSTIITTVFQVILHHTAFEMDVNEAVQFPRFHHQWLPDEIIYEKDAFSDDLLQKLHAMGHQTREVHAIGLVEAISVDDEGIMHGAADKRGDDHAAGL